MGFAIQLALLMWKNLTYRSRRTGQLVIEIVWPLLFFLLIIVPGWKDRHPQEQCNYLNKALPSAGTLPWLRGLFCNVDNPCFRYPTAGEAPGVVDNFNHSILSRLLADTRKIILRLNDPKTQASLLQLRTLLRQLANDRSSSPAQQVRAYLKEDGNFSQFLRTNISFPSAAVEELLGSRLDPRVFSFAGTPLKEIVCNASLLSELLAADDTGTETVAGVQQKLCSLPEATLQALEHSFSQTDWVKVLAEHLNAGPVDVVNTMEALRIFLQRTDALAKEVSSSASFGEFREALRLLSGRDAALSPALALKTVSRVLCGHPEGGGLKMASLNRYKVHDVKSFQAHDGWVPKAVALDNSMTPFCKDLVWTLEASPLTQILWRSLKPLFVGKILYAPSTPATRKVMAEVNRTFQNLAVLRDVGGAWEELGPEIYAFMAVSPELGVVQTLLETPEVTQFLETRLGRTSWNLSALKEFLSPEAGSQGYTWHDAYTQVDSVVRTLSRFMECLLLDKIEALASEEQLLERAMRLLEDGQFWAGVVFLLPDNRSAAEEHLPPHVRFKIRMDINDVTRTNEIKDRFGPPGPAADPLDHLRYVSGGFVYIQDLVEQAVVRVQGGPSALRQGVIIQQMPQTCFVDKGYNRIIGRFFPLLLTLAWMYSVAMIIKGLVHEKETRMKETMKIMGLSNGTLWFGWFLSSLVPYLITIALLVFLFKKGYILAYSNPILIFLFFAAFAVATIALCFLISTLFSRSNMAAACGGIIYFSLYLPFEFCIAFQKKITFSTKILASFLFPVALGYGCEYIALYEDQDVGMQWQNLTSSPFVGDRYNFGTSIVMLLADAAIYGVATWYIEAVFPGEYGIRKPWNFPFLRSYWFGESAPEGSTHPIPLNSAEVIMEEPPADFKVGVSIRNLVKIYHGSNKMAVSGLSLDFYEGQITAFLGHNGAGKTTTMSILTGLFPPTSGTAYILGRDIRTDMDAIRKSLGMCPQHNVLFDILTVEEHIWFFGRLKGLSRLEVKEEMDQLIRDVGLPDKRREQARNLSGGMQRKLSVAIAFVGGSKVVILDEPTAGVDPYSRRGIWELLLKYRPGRTVILSTHYMEEADLLGDRVAIVSQGRLWCCGSSLFLKTKLGSGYYLTLVKREAGHGAGIDKLTALIQRLVPGSKLVEEIGQEVVYVLPHSGAKDGSFAKLFAELDARLAELGVSGYGISDTSLEEIFLKVADDKPTEVAPKSLWTRLLALVSTPKTTSGETDAAEAELEEAKATDLLRNVGPKTSSRLTGRALIWQQMRAVFIKRFLYARRSWRGFFAQIVLPAVFVLIACIVRHYVPNPDEDKPFRLDPSIYGRQFTFFSDDSHGENSSARLLGALLGDPGFGTKCMKDEAELASRKDPCPRSASHAQGFEVPEYPDSVAEVFKAGNWSMSNPSPACVCSSPSSWKMLPECPEAAGGLPPPRMRSITGDVVYNLTGRNISDFLVKTYSKAIRKGLRSKNGQWYGGFSLGARGSQDFPSPEEVAAAVTAIRNVFVVPKGSSLDRLLDNLPSFVDGLETRQNVKVWFNNKGWHAMVSFVNVANNGLLRANLPAAADRSRHGITAMNHPIEITKEEEENLSHMALTFAIVDVVVSICVMFAMSFIPASFILFLIEERVSKSKHVQFVSGMKPTIYWLGNFTWDMCNYLVPAVLVVLLFLCFQQKHYVSAGNLPCLILLLLLYGWSVTPLMYPASFFFESPSTAYVVLTCVNLFIGVKGSLATYFLELFREESTTNASITLKKVFIIFPHFCMGRGLIDMAKNQAMADLLNRTGIDRKFVSPLSWDVAGKNVLAMIIQGAIFFAFTLLMQYGFFIPVPAYPHQLPELGHEDEDVAKERQRVNRGAAKEDIVVMQDLTKVYWWTKKPAVDHLCLGIPAGECFGLLGVNGAGKTTTFKMLTGDSAVTSGHAFLKGYSVLKEMEKAHQNTGYCPQFDGINCLLTGREHLFFYCRLHGIPENEIPGVVKWGISALGLARYADGPAGEYSGGNKRKLSTAIALIGAKPVIFLDEPTTGMDPRARRLLWNCILGVIKDVRSVVLTSHSMEECEALCTRLAIMVNGRFQCLGSVQHLKNKFGEGYTIVIRVSGSHPDTGPVETFIRDSFPGIVLKEKHHGMLQYQMPSSYCSLAKIFGTLSDRQRDLHIEDYSVSQTTLDQVFVHFAKKQSDEVPGGERQVEGTRV